MSWLEIRDVSVAYGVVRALDGVSLSVAEGEIVALVGSNCAGKSTLMKAIMGVVRPSRGAITFAGSPLGGLAVEAVVRRGVVLVPEGRGILGTLTVRENLRLGAYQRRDARIAADLDQVAARFPVLRERLGQKAGSLSGGEQQMLAIARALMARPRLLLLDEPSLGLAPVVIASIFDMIASLARDGVTVLLVEQNAAEALRLAHRAYVLETGRVVLEGKASDLLQHERVREAYLGA
ncbi:MAG TPA: ABC transporter ATP-binding protein [Methylomirabilota bacterium]|jgi:branched-chain amino acid transport system ATP-binding protein|nr:ABC transporter ATP-binding protein [Methylomirabilota bacterium]